MEPPADLWNHKRGDWHVVEPQLVVVPQHASLLACGSANRLAIPQDGSPRHLWSNETVCGLTDVLHGERCFMLFSDVFMWNAFCFFINF